MKKCNNKIVFRCLSVILVFFAAVSLFSVGGISVSAEARTISPSVIRMGGADRYDTSVRIAQTGWSKSKYVVLASANSYADALAGAPLAYALDAPILLVQKDSVSSSVLNEIRSLGVETIYILGGSSVIGSGAERDLSGLNCSVVRIAGKDRFETAAIIAQVLDMIRGKAPREVFIASGVNYPDALSASSVASLKGCPILYSTATGVLTEETVDYLNDANTSKAYILGGTAAISDSITKSMGAANISQYQRLGGADRYETSLIISKHFDTLFAGGDISFATGKNFPDALAGGVFAAKKGVPVLLTDNSSVRSDVKNYVAEKMPRNVYVFGGEGVVSEQNIKQYILNEVASPEGDVRLKLSADNVFVFSGENASICFTAETSGVSSSVVTLHNDTDSGYVNMYDNGENGDKIQGDGIYTCVVSYRPGIERTVRYYAQAGNSTSERLPIYFLNALTEADFKHYDNVCATLNALESEFHDRTGYVPEEYADDAINKAYSYARELVDKGEALDAEISFWEGNACSAWIKLRSGIEVVYIPRVANTLASDDSIASSVLVYQPSMSTFESRVQEFARSEVPQMYNDLSTNIDGVNKAGYFVDSEVDIESFFRMGKNQIILWFGHGCWSRNHTYIEIGVDCKWSDSLASSSIIDGEYVGLVDGKIGVGYKYLQRVIGDMSGSYLYLDTCYSGCDRDLCDFFINRGVVSLVVNSGPIEADYGLLMGKTTTHLLSCVNESTGKLCTLGESLEYCKKDYKDSDKNGIYAFVYGKGEKQGRYRIALPTDVTVKVTDQETGGNIAADEITITYHATGERLTVNHLFGVTFRLYNGDYTLVCSRDGYYSCTEKFTVESGVSRAIEMKMKKREGLCISGTVCEENGTPVANAEVNISDHGGVYSDYTDVHGCFSIEVGYDKDIGREYTITAGKGGYEANSVEVSVPKNFSDGVFSLSAPIVLKKSITDSGVYGYVYDNDPVPDAIVHIYRDDGTQKPEMLYDISTDTNGYYSAALEPGNYLIEARGDKWSNMIKVQVYAKQYTESDIYIIKGAYGRSGICGRVFANEGVPGAVVQIYTIAGHDAGDSPIMVTTTDNSGCFSVELPVGGYIVQAYINSGNGVSLVTDIYAETVTGYGFNWVDLGLFNRSHSIYGYVYDRTGNPINNAIVGFFNSNGSERIGFVRTDSMGYFDFYPGTSSAMYRIQVSYNGKKLSYTDVDEMYVSYNGTKAVQCDLNCDM